MLHWRTSLMTAWGCARRVERERLQKASSWWPGQLSPSQDVDVKMVNWLSAVLPVVDHCRGQKDSQNSIRMYISTYYKAHFCNSPTLYPSSRDSCFATFLATTNKCPKSWSRKKRELKTGLSVHVSRLVNKSCSWNESFWVCDLPLHPHLWLHLIWE